ncbi:vWA domain-containing protein [Haliangium sp.]|uniref:vWA domain-containing protein n=1 Tax=Haliangium sp. TaxID=2663208 RepID=UPI003D0BD473
MTRARSLAAIAFAITSLLACQRADGAGKTPPAPTPTPTPAPGAALHKATPPPPIAKGSVSVEVIPQYEQVHTDTRELALLVRLTGTGEAPSARPPLDLSVVIDRSGSMNGDKLRDVKTAALELLDTLRPVDTVTLISYSDQVERLSTRQAVDAAGRQRLRRALLRMDADGMTALGPALVTGLEMSEAGKRDDLRLAHVLLFSDGMANVGEQRPEVLGARAALAATREVSVSTLGVGVDYNEDLMTKLADQGGGRYHFIKDSQAIAGILSDEMNGLVATVARGVNMSLSAAPGVEVTQVHGYATTRDGATTQARIGSLGAGQRREIIVRVRLPRTAPPRVALGTLAVQFSDLGADGAERRIDVPVAIGVTADVAVAQASEHKDVTVRVAEVDSAETLELAARAADRGDYAAASASLDQALTDLASQAVLTPSKDLDERIVELEEAKQELGTARESSQSRKGYSKKLKARAYRNRKK